MNALSPRILNSVGFLACAGLMAYALYAEHMLFLDPCPLCSFQRLAVIVLGLVFLVAALHNPGRLGGRIYGFLLALVAASGAAIAAWHVRLQNLPADEVPSCGPGLGYILENNSFGEALAKVFGGSGECATVDWQFLGLSMPAWVLVSTLCLGGFALYANLRRTAA